jgi:hypothetical protein
MEQLKNKIKEARPNIRDSSMSMYLKNLNKLNKEIGNKNNLFSLKVLEDKKAVDSFLSSKADSTKKNYYASVVVLLMLDNDNEKLIDEYRVDMEAIGSKLKEKMSKNKKSEKQQNAWTTVAELQKVIKDYNHEINAKKLFKKTALTASEFDLIQRWVVANLYVGDEENPPVRADYGFMGVIRSSEYNRMNKDQLKNNYLVIRSPSKKFFHFGDFKTSSKYEPVQIPVGKKLNTVLNKWLKVNNSGWLLVNKDNSPMSPNQLSKYVTKTFSPLGKSGLGISMLRHIVISEKFPPQTEEKEELAEKMMHSVNVQQGVYAKQ